MPKVYEDENITLNKQGLNYDVKSKSSSKLTNFKSTSYSCSFSVKWEPVCSSYAYNEYAFAA